VPKSVIFNLPWLENCFSRVHEMHWRAVSLLLISFNSQQIHLQTCRFMKPGIY